jgi:hypothetical protein
VENDIQIVNHKIEDDIDIERAGCKYAEAVRLKEHGPVEQRLNGEDGGVESLKVADLQDAAMLLRNGDEIVGFRSVSRDGLFNEEINLSLQQWSGDCVVLRSGNTNGCRIDADFSAVAGCEGIFD